MAGPEPIIVPAALSLNGNTVTLAERWAEPILRRRRQRRRSETARRFGALIRERGEKPVLAVVHTFSTHNLLLRYWLAAGGIDPDREVAFTVVPPAETAEALAAGKIDGFCAGAPWGEVAARAGIGRTVATSSAIWNHGARKVFAVRQRIADEDPDRLQAALRALLRAAAYCDDPANAPTVAEILARGPLSRAAGRNHPDLAARRRRAPGGGGPPRCRRFGVLRQCRDLSLAIAGASGFSARCAAGVISIDSADLAGAAAIFRPDLYAHSRALARAAGARPRRARAKAITRPSGSCPPSPAPIAMGPDHFMDGAVFDPDADAPV